MLQYHIDLSKLPFRPGDDLYSVAVEEGYAVIRTKNAIDGIVVMEDGVGILAYGTLFLDEDRYCLTSLEHAKKWVRANRPALPCPYIDMADCWLQAKETLPADSRMVTVLSDNVMQDAYFDRETGCFYVSDEVKVPIENVEEWTENPDSKTHRSIQEIQVEERREPKPGHLQGIEM